MTIIERFDVMNIHREVVKLQPGQDAIDLAHKSCMVICRTCGAIVLYPNKHHEYHERRAE